ncbi:type VI secretion system-associated protein [Gammaproteobacteria bacterium 45_16_T64]|nr:type VI secretion system-associated protein [Gammaproteobacteria bacterium 45_16_T64]
MSKDATVAPQERINIKYKSESGGASDSVELPLKSLVLGDFTLQEDDRTIEERKPINIDKENFNDVLRNHKVGVDMTVPNHFSSEEDAELGVSLKFETIKDFGPESVARQVPELNSLMELRDALVALKGPLGNVPAFRKAIESILTDDEQKEKLLGELKITE